jgi:CRISPR-associated protein Cas1
VGFHIINIDSPNCSISCRDGQLTCKTAEGERKVPLEDVASIIITSFSAQIHSHLFLEAAKHGVALIICEAFKPVSLVLPANRSTDTLLSRALLKLEEKSLARLWQGTVDAKCKNQHSLAEHLAPGDPALALLRDTAFGRKPHKEGICAKLFWQTFGRAMGEEDFSRERSLPGLNSLLNYGYAVLLSTVLQKLFAVGLDPTFGISHAPRERSTPLAYDLMEPFRPCVDWRVAQWVRKLRATKTGEEAARFPLLPRLSAPLEVSKEFRAWVTGFPLEKVEYLDLTLDVRSCIEGVVRGFRRAVLTGDLKHYKPWTPRSSKWAG